MQDTKDAHAQPTVFMGGRRMHFSLPRMAPGDPRPTASDPGQQPEKTIQASEATSYTTPTQDVLKSIAYALLSEPTYSRWGITFGADVDIHILRQGLRAYLKRLNLCDSDITIEKYGKDSGRLTLVIHTLPPVET